MWDLKLYLFDAFFYGNVYLYNVMFAFLNAVDPLLQNGLLIFNLKTFYQFPQNTSFFFAIKFCSAICFLVLCRGGIPRYRYDYLTKLGWLKFMGLVVLVFFVSLLTYFIF